MTDKEVMQMALDALEKPHPSIRTDLSDAIEYRKQIKEAIEALRTALAQPEKEWVELTDEEMEQIFFEQDWCDDFVAFEPIVFVIEAKLRERNT